MSLLTDQLRDEFLGLGALDGDDPPLMASVLALSRLLQRGHVWDGWESCLASVETAAP